LSLPVQYTLYHRGGQLDTLRSQGAQLHANQAIGLVADYYPNPSRKNQYFRAEGYALHSSNSVESASSFTQGQAMYFGLSAAKSGLILMAQYWDAYQWTSTVGGELYQTVPNAVYATDGKVNGRKLLFIRVLYSVPIWKKSGTLSLRVEPYQDLNAHTWEYSYGLYLRLRPSVVLYRPNRPGRHGRHRGHRGF
jgi:hypothetical protein